MCRRMTSQDYENQISAGDALMVDGDTQYRGTKYANMHVSSLASQAGVATQPRRLRVAVGFEWRWGNTRGQTSGVTGAWDWTALLVPAYRSPHFGAAVAPQRLCTSSVCEDITPIVRATEDGETEMRAWVFK